MDPYDVLGVRANAVREEIELAYKGRRSQYHPDRYSDPEGVAWATAKMQELNAAYAAIQQCAGDGAKQQCADTDVSRQTAPRKARESATLGEFLRRNPNACFESDKIFFQPNIPLKKLRAALDAYGEGLAPDDVRILIDDTVFGGAREGALFTDAEGRFKDMFLEWHGNVLGVIKSFRADGLSLFFDEERAAKFHTLGKRDLQQLCSVLNKFAEESTVLERAESQWEEPPRRTASQPSSRTPSGDIELGAKELFRSLHGNIFDSIQSTISQTNRQPTNRVGQELGRTCWAMLDMAMTMPVALGSGAVTLTEEEWEILSSDTIRLEFLIFILACVLSNLRDECEEEEVDDRFAAILMITLTPYVLYREGLEDFEQDLNSSSSVARLQKSALLQKAMKRLGSYEETIALGKSPAPLFIDFMRNPTDFALIDREAAKEMGAYVSSSIGSERFLAPITQYLEMLQSRTSALVSHFVFTT